jgi:hypothetical protein
VIVGGQFELISLPRIPRSQRGTNDDDGSLIRSGFGNRSILFVNLQYVLRFGVRKLLGFNAITFLRELIHHDSRAKNADGFVENLPR